MKHLYFFFSLLLLSPAVNASEPIIIGLDADMSAVAAEGGTAIQRGAQLAIDDINNNGGLLGRQLQLVVRDHRGNPARGIANIHFFATQQDVVAVIGGVHTPVALHELPAIHQHKMIYLSPWAAGTGVVDNGYQPNYVFRLSVRDEHAGYVLMNRAKQRGFKRVGLLLERTGWGRSNEKSMTAAAKQHGLSIVATEWFNWREPSMVAQINILQEHKADVIFLVANAPEGAKVIKEIASRPQAQRLPVLSHWGIASGAFVKQEGIETIQQVDLEVLQTYSKNDYQLSAKVEQLLTAYQQRFGVDVTLDSLSARSGVIHAYDLVQMLALAIKQAGTIDRGKVRDELENIQQYSGLFKLFEQPFTPIKHDALTLDDYHLSRYNPSGYLIPANEQ